MEEFVRQWFFNCDISLLKYGYYREADTILKNFKIRLRKLLMLDAVPAAIICGMILLWTLLCGEILSVWKVIPLMAGSLLLSAFFCLFHLFMYYITQPYTEEKTVKSPNFFGGKCTGVLLDAIFVCRYRQVHGCLHWECLL